MRRREKFVIVSILLSLGLFALQYVGFDWRYLAVAVFVVLSYFASAWALSEDLQTYEWLTIVPQPALYAGAVGLFYFLLPSGLLSQIAVLAIFGVGMYALYLTANIFSVAKGRTIQLLYAAHAVGLFFTLITSLLFTNTIFSLGLPFYGVALLVGLAHFLLVVMSLWSVRLENFVSKETLILSGVVSLFLAEASAVFSLLPMPIWYSSLFVMTMVYLSLSVLQNLLKGRLFYNILQEYTWVATLLAVLFLALFPWK
jgi:hypothetical protein